eukprot:TRINITY_DN78052_c0_g1_i1.p3 TRINITY_DN78052_c0_g1~~TRINITY_DN78052_c0_g1_i1.p3  ORF type:complete len:107 (+),score=20.08 TRINITY_DN78052_c0_g1_i1:340-660(+)
MEKKRQRKTLGARVALESGRPKCDDNSASARGLQDEHHVGDVSARRATPLFSRRRRLPIQARFDVYVDAFAGVAEAQVQLVVYTSNEIADMLLKDMCEECKASTSL